MTRSNKRMDPRGHRATSPWQMPPAAWKAIGARTYKRTWDDNIGLVASGVAFYGFFALLSLLAMIVLAYGLVAEPMTVIKNMDTLTRILPSDVAGIIGSQLLNLVHASESRKGFAILLAALVALYGGINGAASILTALNIAYEEKEKRSLLRFYLVAFAMTVTALILALCALGLTAAVAYLQSFIPDQALAFVALGQVAGYVFLFLVAAVVAATLYRFGPSREDARWRWITPGSVVAAASWMLLTAAFGYYVGHLTNYQASYGSLGAVVALLSWLYLSAYTFMFGAELNSEIEHQTAVDSTTGKPEPLGKRGAWAADNVAGGEQVQDRPEEKREGEKLTKAQPQVAEEEKKAARKKSKKSR